MNTWSINLMNSNSPIFDLMILFHDLTMIMMSSIISSIMFIMMKMMLNKNINRFLLHNNQIEIIWTIIPMIILTLIAIPSIKILYLTDEIFKSKLTIKTIGHQWFWSYEYSDFKNIEFDSYMIPSTLLKKHEFRLLDVDNRCILPLNTSIRILTTSMDVIHSWTVPSLGIKMDSTPGRLNQSTLYMYRPGLYFGQCSEICGMNHSFMPIVVESTNNFFFLQWMNSF